MKIARRMSLMLVLAVILLAALALSGCSDEGDKEDDAAADIVPAIAADAAPLSPEAICDAADVSVPDKREYDKAGDVLQDGVDYWAVICTQAGPIVIDLYEAEAPITVNNFVFLAQNRYYNDTVFHRVLAGFMAQGGDPTGTGTGGPGYTFEDETGNGLVFDTIGLLAMANAGANTNGSQFFITYAKTTWLDGNHTIFGRVTSGMDHAELLPLRNPQQPTAFPGAALNTVVIVEGPDAIDAEPDGAPSIEHFNTLLNTHIVDQINLFALDDERSGVHDLDAEAATWEAGGDALVADMTTTLADSGFEGSASIWLTLDECAPTPEEGPIWEIALRIMDFGASGAEAVVLDDDRADQIVDSGMFSGTALLDDDMGRIFEGGSGLTVCGDDAVQYRLEYPYGRYLLVATITVDGTVVNADAEMPADQLGLFVMEELLLKQLMGVFDRGNAVLAAD